MAHQTFVAALRHDRLDAPWVINGAMNAEMFDLYTKTQLVPTLRPRDLVILDNLSSHKSSAAAAALRDTGPGSCTGPPYSPDLNPIEMAFSKLKALIRKAAARTCDQLWTAVGQVCNLFLTRMLQVLQGGWIRGRLSATGSSLPGFKRSFIALHSLDNTISQNEYG